MHNSEFNCKIGALVHLGLACIACLVCVLPVSGEESRAASSDTLETQLKPYVKLDAGGDRKNEQDRAKSAGSEASVESKNLLEGADGPAHKETELDAAVKAILSGSSADIIRLRKDKKTARRLAGYHWLDRAAAANPQVIEAITNHRSAAKILASHPRLAVIAEADHYTCRRITQWKEAARVLAKNAQAREVVGFDPLGIYVAIQRDKKIIRILSKNPMFDQMIVDNPDLERVIAKYM